MFLFVFIVLSVVAFVWSFLQSNPFGKTPSGERLERIQRSPNYKHGQFQNLHHTPTFADGANMLTVMKKFFFEKGKHNKPPHKLPSVKTNLHDLDPSKNVLVWFGHSSYFMQVDGKKILVDPVFSGAASPISFTTKSFPGSDVYKTDDIPDIDLLFITHDHWDHLDYKTVVALQPKVKRVITTLGTGEHLERWGFDNNKIIELDWYDQFNPQGGFTIFATPGRHFSGRGLQRNKALWASFVLQTPTKKLFIGGDSGYDTHFAEIGNRYGPFDLAILECGQYNIDWKYIHILPEEVVDAGVDLKTKAILPVHWSKFSLAMHDWNEPIKKVKAEAERRNIPLLHPMIGEEVNLDKAKEFGKWWEMSND